MRNCASGNLGIRVRCRRPAPRADLLAWPRNDVSGLAAPDRGHGHLVAAAASAIDFLAGAELQILAQTDPHLTEPGPVAGHGDCRSREPGIDLDEGLLDLGGG